MQIGKLNLSNLSAPIFGTRSNEAGPQLVDTPLDKKSDSVESSAAQSSTYREILANYDVTHITPQQFSQLIHELHSAGAINDSELHELASIRFELDRSEYSSNEPVDLVDLFSTRVDDLLQSSEDAGTGREESDQSPESRQESIGLAKRQLEWLQKFATLHSDTSREGLNALI